MIQKTYTWSDNLYWLGQIWWQDLSRCGLGRICFEICPSLGLLGLLAWFIIQGYCESGWVSLLGSRRISRRQSWLVDFVFRRRGQVCVDHFLEIRTGWMDY